MVHGNCKSEGCFAMTDKGIEEIYLLVEQSLLSNNTPVPIHIFPFKMTPENMLRFTGTQWETLWAQMKQGYDAFESSKVPPKVFIKGQSYIVQPQIFIRRDGA